ncbi:cytochrome ubiquinol oxidase subunit I [Candidatus Marsarchaeota archaeon]|nr:cytochrome ubiquinol oxidase subunit I [Candidatus Marsarchaeota archaeon]
MLIVGFDRFLMGFSLAVHIGIVMIGMALPLIIVLSEFLGIRRNDEDYLALAKRLTKILVVFFAIGTASGTVVAMELLLLWPKFMALVGQVSILPLYIEVFAFFMEAIFLAIYVYSWNRFTNKYVHLLAGVFVCIGAALSAVLITMLNAFMNNPTGFDISAYLKSGIITGINPVSVLTSPPAQIEIIHVLVTTYFAGAFVFAGYMAYMLIRSSQDEKRYYKKGIKIAFSIALIATLLSVYTGILTISSLEHTQPEKYAAIEADLYPHSHAAEIIGGIFSSGAYHYFISIPNLQSILEFGNASGVVPGLSQYPQSTWPPLFIHLMFDTLVGLGFLFAFFVIVILLLCLLKKDPFQNRLILKSFILAAVLSVFMLEDGWAMAEIGRQPWIIYNVMLVSQAANTSPSLIPIAIIFAAFYLTILPLTVIFLRKIFRNRPISSEAGY